jgi:transcriptional regulator with XRE-family HTH domain
MVEFPWSRQQNNTEEKNRENSRENNREQWEKNREQFREQFRELQEQLKENTLVEDEHDSAVTGTFRFSSHLKRQNKDTTAQNFGSNYGYSGIEAVHKGVAKQEAPAEAASATAAEWEDEAWQEPSFEPSFESPAIQRPEVAPVSAAVEKSQTPTPEPVIKPNRPAKKKAPGPKDQQAAAIGLIIKSLMKEKGYNNKQLAEKLGYDKGTIGNYLTGERKPSISFIIDTARLFGVSADYILGLSDYRREEQSRLDVSAVGLSAAATQKLINNQGNRNYGLLMSYFIERLPDSIIRRIITSLRVGKNQLHSAQIVTEPFSFKITVDERGNQRYLVNTDDAQALLTEHILAQFRRFFVQMANDEELLNQMFHLETDDKE